MAQDLLQALRANLDNLRKQGVKGFDLSQASIVKLEKLGTHTMQPPTAKIMRQAAETLKAGETIADIKADLGDCQRCGLCKGRHNIVFGTGSPHAKLVFVGEGPGHDEDMQGIPFVGAAGQLLTKIIEAMKLSRDQVYICNVVKCRPPGNRNPAPDEIAACLPFLERQLAAINPLFIIGLGSVAVKTLLNTDQGITKLRGQWGAYCGVKLMPTYHPSYLLRNASAKRDVWEDVQLVMKEYPY